MIPFITRIRAILNICPYINKDFVALFIPIVKYGVISCLDNIFWYGNVIELGVNGEASELSVCRKLSVNS